MSSGSSIGRREFLKRGSILGIGASLLPLGSLSAAVSPDAEPRIRRYSPLGRTGIKMSDISFGSARLRIGEEDLVRHALDRGVNYFDTAETYTGGEAETTIGNALHAKRDKVFITSKVITSPETRKEQIMASLEGSLRRLQTDYVDIYFCHAVNDVERIKSPEWHEFTDLARKQGKIRFTGLSGHAGRLIECLDYAIDSGRFDVMLCAHNFGQDPHFYSRFFRSFDFVAIQPDLPRVMAKAKQKGMGVVAMKTLMGARLNDMRPYETGGATFAQAAFRWVLSSPHVDGLVITMTGTDKIDEFLGASGWRTAAFDDSRLLKQYARLNSASSCRHGCNACESSCPYGVPIADVMRTRMYAHDYGDLRLARDEYTMLGAGAFACLSCAQKPCAGACPQGIPIDSLLAPTHQMLATG